ncbi:MAG: GNAT family N-acyltransferase [Bacteriovoracia bacterium]
MSQIIHLRKFEPRPETEIEFIHSPFHPVEVRESDPISATVYIPDQDIKISAVVWRLSPLGAELILKGEDADKASKINVGCLLNLTISLNKTKSAFIGLAVACIHNETHRRLIGVRWCSTDTQKNFDHTVDDRRSNTRWMCGSEFMPTGIAPNPIRFNDFIHFRIRDISRSGMQLVMSLRNKWLIPGMELDSMVSFPVVGDVNLKLKLLNTRILAMDGKEYLSVGTKITNSDSKINETIGQYVFQFGPKHTIEALKKEGLDVSKASGALEFGCVRTASEYEEVLNLRHMAYLKAGKAVPTSAVENSADVFDSRSRILTVRHRGDLVASLRVMYHELEDTTEHERFVKLPESIPRKDEIVEVTRICTHPAYRGSDLLYALIKQMTLTVLQSKRQWILGSAEEKLVPLYKKLGYQALGVYFEHGDIRGLRHELLLGHLPEIISGKSVSAAIWNELYSDLTTYLIKHQLIEFDPTLNFRHGLYTAISPITKLFTKGVRFPKKA